MNLRFPHAGYREKIWDHAAGALIVTEAGAAISDAAGALPRSLPLRHGSAQGSGCASACKTTGRCSVRHYKRACNPLFFFGVQTMLGQITLQAFLLCSNAVKRDLSAN